MLGNVNAEESMFEGISKTELEELKMASERMQLATDVANVIVAEEYCGMSYNYTKVNDFLATIIKADDFTFNSLLDNSVLGRKFVIKDHSKMAKVTFCTQMKRVAKHYELID